MTPVTQRRLQQFKANRRGYWSLWLFLLLFVVTLSSEFIANDRPAMVWYKGEALFPIFKIYPETKFGGDFQTEADYRDEFVEELIEQDGFMVWPLVKYSYDTVNFSLPCAAPSPPPWLVRVKWGYRRLFDENAAPTGDGYAAKCERKILDGYATNAEGLDNYFGSDDQGRDVVARVMYGFRISVLFGLMLTGLSSVIGMSAGAFQGYYGGRLDLGMQRVIEVWSSLPSLYILIIFSSLFVPGFWTLLLILLLFSWMALNDIVRAEFLRARNYDYVRAAKSLGVGNLTIMWRHVLPNAMVGTITMMPFVLTGSITSLTALDFLGLGLPPGSASLGELLKQGKDNLNAPWLGLTAFFSLSIMLTLLTFVGEAVRDAFDPRKTQG